MKDKEPGGQTRLLYAEDAYRMNSSGRPIVGWKSTSQGEGLYNPMGFALMRVVVQKLINGQMEDLYDQPIIVEKPGAVVIPQLGNKIGFIQNFRFCGDRIKTASPDYILSLNEEGKWAELAASLGAWRWELPAGIAPNQDGDNNLEEIIIKAAKLEALQESGLSIDQARIVGKVNFNPTFFAHAQYIVHGIITGQIEQAAEDYEILGGVHLFELEEIRQLINSGDFDDGRSLAALAMAGIHIPK